MDSGGECSGTAADDGGAHNLPPACAACRFQRRRCSPDCPLAPYFPANRFQDFQNVRKLFGVKNIIKILADLEPDNRLKAAECMIFEANCRATDLAGGCYRIIVALQSEIMLLEAQHHAIIRQLRFLRLTKAAAIRSEFEIDSKAALSSLLLDCDCSDDWIRKEFNNLNNDREVSFSRSLK